MYSRGQVVTIKETHKRGIICDKLKTSDRTLYQIKSEDNIISNSSCQQPRILNFIHIY